MARLSKFNASRIGVLGLDDEPIPGDAFQTRFPHAISVQQSAAQSVLAAPAPLDPIASPSAIIANAPLASAAQAFAPELELSSLDGTNGFQINGETVGDRSGWSVASAGDVNGDGFGDLIVGAYGADPNGNHSGASYVVFGKASGFGATLELSSLNGANGFQINGEAYSDQSGLSVSSAGDVNGDGFDDLIVGAHGANPNGAYSGASYVVFGKASAFAATLELSSLDGANGFQINGEAAVDFSGRSVASAGDVNGDGFADLIVGAIGADPNGAYSGASYVVFGKASGFAATLELSSLNGANGFQINGEAAGEGSGLSVSSAGDVNGDGFDDLIVSAPDADPNGIDSGASYVIFGHASVASVIATPATPQDLSTMAFLSWAAYSHDAVGSAVSAGTRLSGSGWEVIVPFATNTPLQLGMLDIYNVGDYFSHDNAAALVAIKGGVLAIAIRGSDQFPVDQAVAAFGQLGHFDLLVPLFDAVLAYIAAPPSGVTINKVYITGHSLGGAMAELFALKYFTQLASTNLSIEVATFGSPGTQDNAEINALAPNALTDAMVQIGHEDDEVFNHTYFATGDFVRRGNPEIVIVVPDENSAGINNHTEHSPVLYQRSLSFFSESPLFQRYLDNPIGRTVIVDSHYPELTDSNDFLDASLFASFGAALVIAADGVDIVLGTDFADWIDGGSGDDTLNGGVGGDTINGGAGSDFAGYFNAAAGLTASLLNPGANTGEAAGDTYVSIENLVGSRFSDVLIGDGADNTLQGGEGGDTINGGAGSDFAGYFGAAAGLTASLLNPGSNTGEAAGDTYVSIENLVGSRFSDVLIGDGAANTLQGGEGGDTINGGAGFDYAGYFYAAVGLTASLLNPGSNTGEAAGDTYVSIEGLFGSLFSDVLIGDGAANALWGNDGDDTLYGGVGGDTINGGAGSDYAGYFYAAVGLTASLLNPGSNTGEAAGDIYVSIENLYGSRFSDVLIGDGAVNTLEGGVGGDTINGGAGFDYAGYSSAAAGLTASLLNPGANTGEAAGDTYVSIEGLFGSLFSDVLIGDGAANALWGNDGDDTLYGGVGGDTINGGAGFDYAGYFYAAVGLTASLLNPGSNTGEAAGDTYVSIEGLFGSLFSDVLIGDGAANALWGNDGDDTLYGGVGGDTINGGAGSDYAGYANAAVGLTANLLNPGSNTSEAAGDIYVLIENLRGSALNDILGGDDSANALRGEAGADTLQGQGGNDILIGGAGADVLGGGAGIDTADYSASGAAVNVNLAAGSGLSGDAQGDSLFSIEIVTGSAFADTLSGRDFVTDTLNGGDGDDVLMGRYGGDVLNGGAGIDTLSYVSSLTGVDVRLFNGLAIGGEANGDVYTSIENIIGTATRTDTLAGDDNANSIWGGGGNETIAGRDGSDHLYGEAGNDTLLGGAADDFLIGGAGADTLGGGVGNDTADYSASAAGVTVNLATGLGSGGDAQGDGLVSIENVIGSAFNDVIVGKANATVNVFDGGAGDDVMTGGLGGDAFVFRLAQGSDTITDFIAGAASGDEVGLAGFGTAFDSFAEAIAAASQIGADTIFDFGAGQTLTLQNVTLGSLTAGDFIFGP